MKADVLAQLGRIAVAGTVIATNTSYLDVNRLAEASGRPQDIIGLHFFAPAEIMRLVEVVRGGKSAPDAVATGLAIARRLGKLPVVAGVCDGFVGNRILSAYRGEMEYALEDGALPWEVDAALKLMVSPWGRLPSPIFPASISHGRGESGWPPPALLPSDISPPPAGCASWGGSAARRAQAGIGTTAANGSPIQRWRP